MTRNQKDTSPGSSFRTSGTSPSESSEDSTIISELLRIKGDIAGQEDLTIQGRVEGTIELKDNHVTVSRTGQIVHGRTPIKRVASKWVKRAIPVAFTTCKALISKEILHTPEACYGYCEKCT